MSGAPKWDDEKADNPSFLKAPAEVRRMGEQDGAIAALAQRLGGRRPKGLLRQGSFKGLK
jgi:hypothetical protein